MYQGTSVSVFFVLASEGAKAVFWDNTIRVASDSKFMVTFPNTWRYGKTYQ